MNPSRCWASDSIRRETQKHGHGNSSSHFRAFRRLYALELGGFRVTGFSLYQVPRFFFGVQRPLFFLGALLEGNEFSIGCSVLSFAVEGFYQKAGRCQGQRPRRVIQMSVGIDMALSCFDF